MSGGRPLGECRIKGVGCTMTVYRISYLAFLATLAFSPAAAQNNCDALLQHGLSDISTSFGAGHSLVTNYQRHCGTIDRSTSNRTVARAGFEIFGYLGGDGDADVQRTRRRIETWCNTNRDFAQANSMFFEETRHINTAAVQAYGVCQELNRRDIEISVQRSDEVARNVAITIDSRSPGVYRFLGIVNRGYSCQYFLEGEDDRDHKNLDTTTRIDIPIRNDNIHIICSREDPENEDLSAGVARLTYQHGSITVITSAQTLQLEFPEVVNTYFATPPGTILPILGTDCPAGWHTLNQAEGRFLIGASDGFPLASTGGLATIPTGGEHSHTASSATVMQHPHPNGLQARGPDLHLHEHNISVSANGAHNHGGNNMPPYLAVTFCRN